ncbi:translocation channel protein [Saccharomycopsis crataegensis]|uniref:Mitochondrial import inner membrane translocase subunit TIM22 n=1 Tax=Saccharomycopsis crataegensis TaxID=43959 RepID=A0AAV5QHB2_9ASCO|nr:translocation channel protein [Saccharomycopsis crataegensis]
MNNPYYGQVGKTKDTRSLGEMTPEEQGDYAAEQIIEMTKSCPGKTVMSGVTGYFLGGFFGLFMASMSYDVPGMTPGTIQELPFKKQMKIMFSDMGKRMVSSARNFGLIGAIYSGTECSIESLRAKNDIWNSVGAGCLTGGGLAVRAGPQAAAVGCAGFAAFSTAVELYMRSEEGQPPKNDYDE